MARRQIIGRGATCARWAPAACATWLALLAAAGGGCQWILDDVSEPGSDASRDGFSQDADMAGIEAEDGGHATAGDAGRGGEGERDGASPDGGTSMPGLDAASGGGPEGGIDAMVVAEGGVIGHDAAGARDSAAPPGDVAVTCSEPVVWYADDDDDGYGRASSQVRACPAPARSRWALVSGDCNDDDPRVHPDQADYFDEPYQAPDGSASFDYDCSGMEEGNGQQNTMASDACGLLTVTLCAGNGYLPIRRAGASNTWCGSHQKVVCQAALLGIALCEGVTDDVIEPYWCH